MKINHQIENEIATVYLMGRLTLMTAKDFRNYIQPLLDDKNIKGFIFDCKDLNMIDSSGIAEIIFVYKILQECNINYVFCELNQMLLDILDNVKLLEKVVKNFSTAESAYSYLISLNSRTPKSNNEKDEYIQALNRNTKAIEHLSQLMESILENQKGQS